MLLIVDPQEEILAAHARLLDLWAKLPLPWTLQCRRPAPTIEGDNLSVFMDVSQFVKAPIHGDLKYQLREPQDAQDEDYFSCDVLCFKFPPTPENYPLFLNEVIPAFLESFRVYSVSLRDDRFGKMDFNKLAAENTRPSGALVISACIPNSRTDVWRAGPVAFYGEELCHHAFGLTPEQAAQRLEGVAEECRLISGGIYVIGSRSILELAGADELCARLMAALNPSRKPWYQFWKK